jgi:beta-lactamase regulating signal transducer with metallopeptidase domain
MNHLPMSVGFELLGLFAAEIGLVVMAVALLLRGRWPVAWKRVLCQIGLLAVLVVAGCEVSGFAPRLAGQIRNWGRTNPAKPVEHLQTSPTPNTPAVEAILPSTNPIESVTFIQPRSVDNGQLVLAAFCFLWIAGTALLACRALLARGLHVTLSLRRRTVKDAGLLEKSARLATALGLHRRIRLIECRRLACPIAFGVFVPTVGLPKNFTSRFDATRQEAMLAHELAHWQLTTRCGASLPTWLAQCFGGIRQSGGCGVDSTWSVRWQQMTRAGLWPMGRACWLNVSSRWARVWQNRA